MKTATNLLVMCASSYQKRSKLGVIAPWISHWFLVLMVLVGLCISTAAQAQTPKRVALLIGNASYTIGRLTNPPNDVREMESALKSVGFSVQIVQNANQNAMRRAVRDFGNSAQGADIAFFYYSGHGTQANGENYLIPVQASIDKDADYEVEAVSANSVMRQLANARPKAAIVVLDACRDNPLAATTKSTAKGLGRMEAPTGTMIAFATAPNTTASDEGLYARALARQIRTPGLELIDVFRKTTAEVRAATAGRQEPRISEVSISEQIYFAGKTISAVNVQPAPKVVADYTYGPVARLSDGTLVVSLNDTNRLVWKTCEEGTQYVNKQCVGTPKLYTLEEAQAVANTANAEGFAGFNNWRVPGYMSHLGPFMSALDSNKIHAKYVYFNGSDGFMTWNLPDRHGWINDKNDLGGGVVFYKSGKYRLRLVRFMQ